MLIFIFLIFLGVANASCPITDSCPDNSSPITGSCSSISGCSGFSDNDGSICIDNYQACSCDSGYSCVGSACGCEICGVFAITVQTLDWTCSLPTSAPTMYPTNAPTTQFPTKAPSFIPTNIPTQVPTSMPTIYVSPSPTDFSGVFVDEIGTVVVGNSADITFSKSGSVNFVDIFICEHIDERCFTTKSPTYLVTSVASDVSDDDYSWSIPNSMSGNTLATYLCVVNSDDDRIRLYFHYI